MRRKPLVKEAFDDVAVGDVVVVGSSIRKVRHVSYDDAEKRFVSYLTFAILRESWTGRPTTLVSRDNLKKLYVGRLARGFSLCTTQNECAVQKCVEMDQDPWLRCTRPLPISAKESVGTVW